MAECLKFITYNVRGLGDLRKRREIFYYLHQKGWDIMFLQETHCIKSKEKIWSNEWGTKIWFAHGTSNTRRVGILFHKSLDVEVHNVIQEETGRFVLLYVTIKKQKWLLVNVYAPSDDRPEFIEKLFREISRFNPRPYYSHR